MALLVPSDPATADDAPGPVDACATAPAPADPGAVLLTDVAALLPLDATVRDVVVLEPTSSAPTVLEPVAGAAAGGTDPRALGPALGEVLGAAVPVLDADGVLALVPDDATRDGAGEERPADATDAAADPAQPSPDVPVGPVVVVPLTARATVDPAAEEDAVAGPAVEAAADPAVGLVTTLAAAGLDVVLVADASAVLVAGAAAPDAVATLLVDPAAGAADVAAVLAGARTPVGRLEEPLVLAADPADVPDEPAATPGSPVTLAEGHGLTYWRFDLGAVGALRAPRGALTVRAEVAATGVATGPVGVTVEGRTGPDAAWVLLGCVDAAPEPGTTVPVELPLDGGSADDVTQVRVSTPDDELVVDVRTASRAEPTPPADGAPAPVTPPAGDPEPTAGTDVPPSPTTPDPAPHPGDDPAAPGGTAPRDAGRIPLRAVIPEPAGGLRLTVADGGLVLGAAQRLPDRWHLTGPLPAITVTDARDDAVGWSVSVRAGALTAPTGEIGAASLGVTPSADGPGLVTAGPAVATSLSGGPGLADPAVLATARGAGRHGPVVVGGQVDLETPLQTPPGAYAGTLTVTLFPVD